MLGVLAVLVRCVIAPGLMPDLAAAAHGVFQLVICTGDGLKLLHGGIDGGSQAPGHQGDQSLCPYSAAGHVPASIDQATVFPADFAATPHAPSPDRVLPASPAKALGARAPPSA
jgi:hypothetical protein